MKRSRKEPKPSSNIFQDDFEGSISSKWRRDFPNNVYSGTISTQYARIGTSSLRIELRSTDPNVYGSKRSELEFETPEAPADECIYKISIFLPNGGDEDYALDPKGSEIICQWHNTPDPGEDWTSPPLALHTYNGRYTLSRCWDSAALSTNETMSRKGQMTTEDLGSYLGDKGNWVDWIFHVKWGWLASHKPFIKIYKDGIKVYEKLNQPNTTNDQKGVYMQFGIYKWDWAQGTENTSILTKRVIYFDAVSIEKLY